MLRFISTYWLLNLLANNMILQHMKESRQTIHTIPMHGCYWSIHWGPSSSATTTMHRSHTSIGRGHISNHWSLSPKWRGPPPCGAHASPLLPTVKEKSTLTIHAMWFNFKNIDTNVSMVIALSVYWITLTLSVLVLSCPQRLFCNWCVAPLVQ